MNCPNCAATTTRKRSKKTRLGYTTFFCLHCCCTFNERTGTPFNFLEFPTDVVLLAVLWRLRYKLSLRDVAEMFLARGFTFTHEAIRDWETRFAPLIAAQLRNKRHGQAGRSWYVDETSLKVHGKWWYLYRAIDQDGNLVDSMLSREAEYGGSPAIFPASRRCGRPYSRAGDNGWAYVLSTSDTRDNGQQWTASNEQIPQ